ncbi:Laccase G [Mycena venus]|uniref:Laccase G n=1 Tax=Mycena venus TaxID=2733690 RepID=A0A8H6XKX9_9AGAR|nr:Laccase G [Mycena venus]
MRGSAPFEFLPQPQSSSGAINIHPFTTTPNGRASLDSQKSLASSHMFERRIASLFRDCAAIFVVYKSPLTHFDVLHYPFFPFLDHFLMAFTPFFVATCLISTVLAASVGSTADLTLTNGDISPDGFTRQAVLVNGGAPGPLITGNKGDEFNLNVIDQLSNETMLLSSSIHWHGFFQPNNSWSDGVAFVTQCPIATGNSFLYTFPTNNQAGTFWYHSHLSTQYCDGLRGPLVVYDPADPHASLYDVDDETTVITLADWYHGPASTLGKVPTLISTLINGLGRFAGGPTSQLAVVSVTQGKRYRMRLISMSCDPNFTFTIDGHTMTIIEADSVNTEPLTVDSIQIFAGQRYSFVLNANADVGNYWIRTVANGGTAGFDNGINSAILRYVGADEVDPTTNATTSTAALVETNLHPLVPTAVPGSPVAGGADVAMNLAISLDFTTFEFEVNGNTYTPPTVPVLLQILSGAQTAADLLPAGNVFTLPANSVIELSIPGGTPGAPHPFHLHGHNFFVIKSAGNSTYNFDNPVIRDVVSTGTSTSDNTTIRFVTDNAGPWILHCHIDFHLELGLFVDILPHFKLPYLSFLPPAQSSLQKTPPTVAKSVQPTAWDSLCPTYDALPSDQL